jgi:hypothetical protein
MRVVPKVLTQMPLTNQQSTVLSSFNCHILDTVALKLQTLVPSLWQLQNIFSKLISAGIFYPLVNAWCQKLEKLQNAVPRGTPSWVQTANCCWEPGQVWREDAAQFQIPGSAWQTQLLCWYEIRHCTAAGEHCGSAFCNRNDSETNLVVLSKYAKTASLQVQNAEALKLTAEKYWSLW